MLVFAMSVRHARSVSDALNVLFGKGFSEWVGVGPDGKSTKENKDVLARYKKNEIPCLVQVDIAGEGFDNPRSSVLVFLNLLRRASVRAVQQVGRGLRRNYDIGLFSDDTCDMFASPDTEMADLIKEMAQQTLSLDTECDAEQGEDETREQKGPRMYDIPPYESTVKNAEHDRSEIVSRIPQQDVDTFRNAVEKREPSAAASVTDERLREILADERIEQLKKVDAMNSDPKALRDKVAKAQSLLVGNAMRVRYGSSAPSSAAGDLHKKINSRWKRSSGVGHSEMLDDDFKRKYNWLSDINSTIKETGDLPQWLQL
jgi:superfamily II DNA or RNA helicase